jgi:hypothetical protein
LKVTAAEGTKHQANDALEEGKLDLAVELFTKALAMFADP